MIAGQFARLVATVDLHSLDSCDLGVILALHCSVSGTVFPFHLNGSVPRAPADTFDCRDSYIAVEGENGFLRATCKVYQFLLSPLVSGHSFSKD